MELTIDMARPVHDPELERWKTVKFPDPKLADYDFSEPNKILQKEWYKYAKEDKFNAFHTLEQVSSEEVLNIIFKHVAASGNSLLHVAASNGSKHVTQLLCHHFPLLITKTNFQGDNALHLAARSGQLDAIKNIVEHVKTHHETIELASLLRMRNDRGNTPLHDAVINGCQEVACFLISEVPEAFYHKNKEDKSPLYLVVESCNNEMFDSLIEKLADCKPDLMLHNDEQAGNFLHLAASMGFVSGAKLLVSRFPIAATKRNNEGNLPIHVACQKGHLEVVRELLAYWMDPMDFLNENGLNVLHVAAKSGKKKIVDEILRNHDLEALINEKDYDGNTPLHLAAMYGRSEVVKALVRDKRVDVSIVNNEKLKPSGVVKKLLEGGRFEAPKSDGKNKRMSTGNRDDAASGEWNKSTSKSQEVDLSKMHQILGMVEKAGGITGFIYGITKFIKKLMFDLPTTSLAEKEMNTRVSNLLVVAVLVVGVAFAGALTVPGSGHDLNSGVSKNLIKAYIFFDMLAMNGSMFAAIVLCWISLRRGCLSPFLMEWASSCTFYSLICLSLAFTFILTITVQERAGYFITIMTFHAAAVIPQLLFCCISIHSNIKSVAKWIAN